MIYQANKIALLYKYILDYYKFYNNKKDILSNN